MVQFISPFPPIMLFGVCFSYNLPKLYFKKETYPLMKLHVLEILKCIRFGFVQQGVFKEVYSSSISQASKLHL